MRRFFLVTYGVLFIACSSPTLHAESPKKNTGATFTLSGVITPETADTVFLFIGGLPSSVKTLDVKINSPGGSTPASQLISSMFEYASKRGLVIRCTIEGIAASAAAFIFESCTVRRMHLGTSLLFHEPFILIPPSDHPLKIPLEMLQEMSRSLTEDADNFALLTSTRLRISIDTYKEKVRGKNWILTASEAFANHATDEVIP